MTKSFSMRWVIALKAEAKEIIKQYDLISFDHEGQMCGKKSTFGPFCGIWWGSTFQVCGGQNSENCPKWALPGHFTL